MYAYYYAFSSGKIPFALPGYPGTTLRVHNLKALAAAVEDATGVQVRMTDIDVPLKNKLNLVPNY